MKNADYIKKKTENVIGMKKLLLLQLETKLTLTE
jgi:hypothetical protein